MNEVTARPLPKMCAVIPFKLREMRAGRSFVPAIVLATNEERRELDLLVIFDANDVYRQEGVLQSREGDQGWEYPDDAAGQLWQEVEALKERLLSFMDEMSDCLFGEHGKPDGNYEDRLRALEGAAKKKK